ncbi:transglycosylase SLT domain-containing protein [Massilia sp. W12]|uniref:lytic transglycosylase domain-containing protein n=1 Tax=Massilia sp. W12 TaxID=3126507 RepID=UPI0030D3489E
MNSVKTVAFLIALACTVSAPLSVEARQSKAAKAAPAKPLPKVATPIALDAADSQFLALRDAVRNDNAVRARQLAAQLKDYAIPAYVDYYLLKAEWKANGEEGIRAFLQKYDGMAIADRVRNDWLLDLGRNRQWALFEEQYPLFQLNDDMQLKCYDLMARQARGVRVTDDARGLLVNPRDYGEACANLITQLLESRQFNEADLWAQIRLAVETGATVQARRLLSQAGVSDKQAAQTLDKPALTLGHGAGGSNKVEHELFILALGRMARSGAAGVANAAQALERVRRQLSEKEAAQGWAQIALPAAQSLRPEAMDYWRASEGALLSPEAAQWKVRSALRAHDFAMVKRTIENMPAELRSEPAWIYWLARALMAEAGVGEMPAMARNLLQSIAGQLHFYGLLAAEELGQKFHLPTPPQALSAAELQQAAQNPGLKRALKFFAMGLRFEGVREWNWELRKMSDRQIIAAAELARQYEMLDRMVNTSDRSKQEIEMLQRYPSPHLDVMQNIAGQLGLDKAWAYGLIRQESRFILNARSSVGASGLMQLMPATASWVAQKIGMKGFAQHQVNDIQTNITLGANYLHMVLQGLNQSQTLASAAYNAGPGRPKNWRSTLAHPVEGAIFAESIPFLETRTYVKNVLANATCYAALFEKKPQSLKARLGTITP